MCQLPSGELLTPANTPSLAFLSFVKEALESKTLSWIPWKRRSSENDELMYTETRRPRNDRALIKSILADGDVGLDELPEAKVDISGPIESVLFRFQCILANALAMTGACHLLVIKKFPARFLELATSKPRDQNLRAPLLSEIIDAEKEAWHAVAAGKFSTQLCPQDPKQYMHLRLTTQPTAITTCPKGQGKDHTRAEERCKSACCYFSDTEVPRFMGTQAPRWTWHLYPVQHWKVQEWQFLQIRPRMPHREQPWRTLCWQAHG